MKAFNSYLEDVLVELKNSKFEREEFEKMGKYIPISNKQKREEEINIKGLVPFDCHLFILTDVLSF